MSLTGIFPYCMCKKGQTDPVKHILRKKSRDKYTDGLAYLSYAYQFDSSFPPPYHTSNI